MNRRQALGIFAASSLLASCAGGSLSDALPGRNAAPDVPAEQFSYEPSADETLRVTVERVSMRGDDDFIPQDPNWLQLRLVLANVGANTMRLEDVKAELGDGTVVATAASAAELLRPPSMVREMATTVGLGAAGMAGMLLFPPAGILAGAAIVGRTAFQGDRMQRVASRLQETALQRGSIAPGTSVAGNVFLPAVRGQVGLIVFYTTDGRERSLRIRRAGRQ